MHEVCNEALVSPEVLEDLLRCYGDMHEPEDSETEFTIMCFDSYSSLLVIQEPGDQVVLIVE